MSGLRPASIMAVVKYTNAEKTVRRRRTPFVVWINPTTTLATRFKWADASCVTQSLGERQARLPAFADVVDRGEAAK